MSDKEVSRLMRKYKKEELATMLFFAQEKLETYHTNVMFHTDGTLEGTTFLINGKWPANITTIKLRASRQTGVEVSYENHKNSTSGYKRHWVYGESAELTRLFREEKLKKERNK